MKYGLPQSVKVCLWSYDTDKIDLSMPDHRVLIVKNVLNGGTTPAVSWLFDTFTKEEISDVIRDSNVSEWNKKSLLLWSLVFNSSPIKKHVLHNMNTIHWNILLLYKKLATINP